MNALKYDRQEVDLETGVHAEIVRQVGHDKTVLELGCATGYMSKALKANGCRVTGVDSDYDAYQLATAACDRAICRDLDEWESVQLGIGAERFHVVVAADVLEHLRKPEAVLAGARRLLLEGGYVVASVPNVAHGSLRLALLAGTWPYSEVGLLDNTHLRFYTRASIAQLFIDCGYLVEKMWRVNLGLYDSEVPWPKEDRFFQKIAQSLEQAPDALAYQFVVRAVPA